MNEFDTIRMVKERVLSHIVSLHGWTVAYGPFKGMKLGVGAWWGGYDATSKILGVYESHVVEELMALMHDTGAPFVDVGAADGFFACGIALSGSCPKVYAFEISDEGQVQLAANARNNGCSGSIEVHGGIDRAALEMLAGQYEVCIVLMDIEGAEYALLDPSMLRTLRKFHMIIELHPWAVERGQEKTAALMASAEQVFNVNILRRGPYDPNGFAELADFKDDERLLAMSEGRPRNMEWLRLSPKGNDIEVPADHAAGNFRLLATRHR